MGNHARPWSRLRGAAPAARPRGAHTLSGTRCVRARTPAATGRPAGLESGVGFSVCCVLFFTLSFVDREREPRTTRTDGVGLPAHAGAVAGEA